MEWVKKENFGFYCINFYRLRKASYLNSQKFRGQSILKKAKFGFLASKTWQPW